MSSEKCECFYNSETGQQELCDAHHAEMMDLVAVVDEVRKVYPDAFLAKIENADLWMVQCKSQHRAAAGLSGWWPSKSAAWNQAARRLKDPAPRKDGSR